ncbi:MAG TPA: M14 family metallopeptidase [bacterium]|nr:M14 family metallopeptidase [bacterium]
MRPLRVRTRAALLAGLCACLASASWAAGLAPYPSPEAAADEARALGRDHPGRVEVLSAGRSAGGREVLAIRISKGGGGQRPAALIGGGIHGDEYIGNRTAMAAARLLTGDDPLAGRVLDKMDVYIIPLINPDGYAATWESAGQGPTKQTRTNGRGVDLNRNFGKPSVRIPLPLGYSGSTDPDSDRFVGPAPFSEPESRNVRRLADEKRFFAAVDFHSSGGLIIPALCDDRFTQRGLRRMARAYRGAQSGKYLITMFAWRLPIYQGSMEEGLYREAGTLALLIELGKPGDFTKRPEKNHFRAFNPGTEEAIGRVADDNARAALAALLAAYEYTGGKTIGRPAAVR